MQTWTYLVTYEMAGGVSVFHLLSLLYRSEPICQRLSDNGDRCAVAPYWRRGSQLYKACPCNDGLECQSWIGRPPSSAYVSQPVSAILT